MMDARFFRVCPPKWYTQDIVLIDDFPHL